ncbi:hypothetical protein HYW17_05435 [Candidatus Uhrbacteria bacterium]|nr:hypothetical protein [Candidatus Uhrbacteria bacterium]
MVRRFAEVSEVFRPACAAQADRTKNARGSGAQDQREMPEWVRECLRVLDRGGSIEGLHPSGC